MCGRTHDNGGIRRTRGCREGIEKRVIEFFMQLPTTGRYVSLTSILLPKI